MVAESLCLKSELAIACLTLENQQKLILRGWKTVDTQPALTQQEEFSPTTARRSLAKKMPPTSSSPNRASYAHKPSANFLVEEAPA